MSVKPHRPTSSELIAAVLDDGAWTSWDEAPLPVAEPGSPYAGELAAAAEKAGTDESIVTGEGRIRGHRVAVIAGEFGFLAGSIGVAAAERIVLAFERATRERLPLFAAPASGGTRMQEGTPAFVTMVKISGAVAAYKREHLPYITYLRHPTTGGVFASWGSLGHVTVGEPGATIGFLGARVFEALYGEPFPRDVQTSENLFAHGLLDAVLPVELLTETAGRFLDLVLAPRDDSAAPDVPKEPLRDVPAWESITRSRNPARPGVRALLKLGATDVLPLFGTGAGEWDRSLFLALARFRGAPCVVLGQDRRGERTEAPLGPSGLRVARRGMKLATELNLPLVSVIDTAGAALSKEAEEGGMAGEIARCLSELVVLEVPTVCVLLGQGTGGGALALMPADRVISAQHSWLSPLPPEGASAILHRTPDRAPELAERQRVRSLDLLEDGIIDRIVAEHPDAADEPEAFCTRMAQAIRHELAELGPLDPTERLAARHGRYRRLGRGSDARTPGAD
ncbi:acetyl-coenzyme A carboxylase carboxyl transferase subunits beta/alpha [Knoellia aerolata]|uniref:Acetyl-CoA carboxylase n=1 Tax=Knoellia aerolata DSM 18566 TaxID=1385519 RepID=A0A0A0K3T2_9MICO|nr:carboxyl transferase domain-containing protein [Knoellia aerolata]KGN42431.1 acetyl-CoA carboxylase [Knoellia aerolata DSM 18566]